MTRFKAIISYDGSAFLGYQIQAKGRTVQAEIEKALQKMHKGERIRVTASGRTDSGVHAKGQVIHFDSPLKIPPAKYRKALQAETPLDISILSVEEVSDDFHARFHTKGKEYRYFINQTEIFDPFNRHYMLHFPYPLQLEQMKKAANILVGKHDFTSFCSAQTERESKVRTIYGIDFIWKDEKTLMISFKGDGFLYNMVRILTGALLDAGQQKLTIAQLQYALAAKDRKELKCKTAPPHGLYLWEVYYDREENLPLEK